jgi:hypothetical protein
VADEGVWDDLEFFQLMSVMGLKEGGLVIPF